MPAFAGDTPIGFRTLTLPDTQNDRPLELVVWYPSVSTAAPQLIADTPVFVGALAVPNAPPAPGAHPLVVFSHGFRGNWGNQSWLATALVRQGYIVAAVNHPGTTTRDRNPAAAARLWQRPGRSTAGHRCGHGSAGTFRFGVNGKLQRPVIHWGLDSPEIAGARFDP